jgi:hypothetical protein
VTLFLLTSLATFSTMRLRIAPLLGYIPLMRRSQSVDPRSLTKTHFDVIVAKAKLDPALTACSLRYSHITMLASHRVGVLVVAARVGQRSPKLTLDTCGHTSVADRQAVVHVLDRISCSVIPDVLDITAIHVALRSSWLVSSAS